MKTASLGHYPAPYYKEAIKTDTGLTFPNVIAAVKYCHIIGKHASKDAIIQNCLSNQIADMIGGQRKVYGFVWEYVEDKIL